MNFLSNFYKAQVLFNGKEYNSIDEVYRAYKKDLRGFLNIEQVLYISTALKFLQNTELKEKFILMDLTQKDKQLSPKLVHRLKHIQEHLKCINFSNIS